MANQLTQIRDTAANLITSLTYDTSGNTLTQTTAGLTTTYAHDERNRLTQVTNGPGGSVAYAYDGQGRLLTRTYNGVTTTFRYNDQTGDLMHELNAQGNVTQTYILDSGGDVIGVRRGEYTYFFHRNAHSDVMAITDEDGHTVATFTYDPWGIPTEYDPTGAPVTLGKWTEPSGGSAGSGLYLLFGGMLYDAAVGLYLTRSRAYNPRTGRFMERDILDEEAKDGYDGFPFGKDAIGSNLYAFCGNNPVTRVDPSGMFGLADMFRAFARALGSFFSNVHTAVRRVASYVSRAVRAVVGISRAVGAAATRIIKKVAPVLRAVTPIFRAVMNRTSFVAQTYQHHVDVRGGGNPYGSGVNYVPPGAQIGKPWHAADINFGNKKACASLGVDVVGRIGGRAMMKVPGVTAGVGAGIYYGSVASSLGMDAHDWATNEMGTPEYVIRTGANVYGLHSGPQADWVTAVPTVMDGYQCLASAEFIGNYD